MIRNEGIPVERMKVTSKNPIITTIYTADPSAHVWEDGKVYIYASHDMDPARGCDLMDRYHVYSSADMVNWVDEGEILRSEDVAWGRPEGGFMWAPDCAYKNGTYYFYYPHPSGSNWNDSWKIGVATSQKPASDFKDQGFIPGLGGFALIDPCVLVDDDGRAYMYYGGGSRCEGGELNDDMMSIKGEMREMEGLEDFHEAAWVFKRADLYYLTYADNLEGNNRMRYATSKHPLGPWTYRGIFLEPTGCSTTHGSVAEFKGQWYLFYHNQEISGQGNLRSMCIDYLYFNEDGTIQTVVQTKEGVQSVGEAPAPNPNQKTYSAETCSVGGGAAVESNEQGEIVINHLYSAGSYCEFQHIDGEKGGRAAIHIRYATAERLAKLNLTVNSQDYSLLNALSTGSLLDYSGRASITVQLELGEDNMIRLTGGNGEVSIESITVSPFVD
jgi:beta-xylosidase